MPSTRQRWEMQLCFSMKQQIKSINVKRMPIAVLLMQLQTCYSMIRHAWNAKAKLANGNH